MFLWLATKATEKGSCDVYYAMKNNNEFSKSHERGRYSQYKNIGRALRVSQLPETNCIFRVTDQEELGKDIWKCDVKILPTGNLEFSNPVNLGKPINTFKKDSPFIHSDNKTFILLVRRITRMGNFDIFMSTKRLFKKLSNPSNIGYPINTHKDEIGFVVSANKEQRIPFF